MVVAPVLFVCKLFQSEHEILMLADNVVGLLKINAKFPIKYFHVAAPMSQQVIDLDNDSINKMSYWINNKPIPFLSDRSPHSGQS